MQSKPFGLSSTKSLFNDLMDVLEKHPIQTPIRKILKSF